MMSDSIPPIWYVRPPVDWPVPPNLMSFSALKEIEACPRRWALRSADYPNIWNRRGYPDLPHPAALEGQVVHLSLEAITKALVREKCSSFLDPKAVDVLKELGGLSNVIIEHIDLILEKLADNPRISEWLPSVRRNLLAQVGVFRPRIQNVLSRLNFEHRQRHSDSTESDRSDRGDSSRAPIFRGSYAEIDLKAEELGWRGIADLLTIRDDLCEIRDFKTGEPNQEHRFQLEIYAVLWWRDQTRNPSSRPADRLVVSYEAEDVEVPAPGTERLNSVENELRTRTESAFQRLQIDPPDAHPSDENCSFCNVRQLCDEYWQWIDTIEPDDSSSWFADLQIELVDCHGVTSWNGVVESCKGLEAGERILLRITDLPFDLSTGHNLRILNVHITAAVSDSGNEDPSPPVVTMAKSSEVFVIPS